MLTVTQEHIDKAFESDGWTTESCIIAQAAEAHFGTKVSCGYGTITLVESGRLFVFENPEAKAMMRAFDSLKNDIFPMAEAEKQRLRNRIRPMSFYIEEQEQYEPEP